MTTPYFSANVSHRYIHANYRFIVDPRGDYHTQAVDADVHLEWNLVLQILASAQSQEASCPICLSTPVAPRMAKCGHIFCLPCLIRYMHSADDITPLPEKKARWKKCPICWDSIFQSETRPVRWFVGQEGETPREGSDVVLRLMKRQAGNTLALPRDGAEALSITEDIPWYFAAEVTDYARVMKGSEDYMMVHFDREISELQLQEKEDEIMFGEETLWTRKAVGVISEAKEKIKGIGNPPSISKKPEERKPKRPPIVFNDTDHEAPEFYLVQHVAKSGQSLGLGFDSLQSSHIESVESDVGFSATQAHRPAQNSHLDIQPIRRHKAVAADPPHHPDAPFFFYQALLHYYLSPLDIRILKTAFGDFSAFPSTILPRVERVSTGHIVDDDLRRRAKYLAHLPYGCEVGFLECNWVDVVAPEVLTDFAGEIERRRKKNMEKEMREEKERVRAEKSEDDKRWAAARRKRPSISEDHFTSTTSIGLAPIGGIALASSSVDLSAPSTSPPWLTTQNRNGSAFASLASPSTSPLAPRTVWGTTVIGPSSPTLAPTTQEHDLAETDGWLQGWEKDLLQEDDLASRIEVTSIHGQGEDGGVSVLSGGHGKKKKNKKITLMTTTARRGA